MILGMLTFSVIAIFIIAWKLGRHEARIEEIEKQRRNHDKP